MSRSPDSEFLTGAALGTRIREVAGGGQARCAVAFWTRKGVAELFPGGAPADARIVCDISMGSTSPRALEDLGAPDNPMLKHAQAMHAKVIISDRGMVLGSANATGVAIGQAGGEPANVETGAFHPAGSDPWLKASEWFERLSSGARDVGQDELDWAESIYRRQPRPRPAPPVPGSLLELVRAAPERFASIGFVFASTSTKPKQRQRIVEAASRIDPALTDRIGDDIDEGIFGGWGRRRSERWPGFFFEFWQPRERLTVYARRLEARVPNEGAVISVRDREGVKSQIGIRLPSAARISKADQTLAMRIRGRRARFFASGPELAAWLEEEGL